jgi:regulator of protease activity HflC (stomatin/prohibitin superfamily)
MQFTKTHTANRGTSTYESPEGLVAYLPKSVGVHPETITIEGLTVPTKSARAVKATMTAEEKAAAKAARKAEYDAMTPAQRAQKRLDAAKAAYDKAQAKAAKSAA